jgi:outer membrane protein insertion porin family
MDRYKILFQIVLISILFFTPATTQAQGKFKVEDVEFEGNMTFTDSRLHRLMLTKPSKFLSSTKFYREVFENDIQNVLSFYRQNGFLEVSLQDTTIIRNSNEMKIDISIVINEGLQTMVEGISIFNNTVFTDSLLLAKIQLRKGEPFRRNRIHEGMLAMLGLYADYGYLEAVIAPDIRINSEDHLAIIDFNVSEGLQYRVGEINISGLEKTNRKVVTRELLFKTGDIINYSKLLESQRRLYLTSLFESVFIRPQVPGTGQSDIKDIQIEIKESLSSEFNISLGYGSLDKLRGRIELFTTNIAGTARQAGVSSSASFIRRAAEASFTEPRTLGSRWKTDFNVMYEYLEEPGYDVSRFGGRLTVGRNLGRYSDVSLAFRLENADLRNIEISEQPEELDPKIRSFIISLIHDTRDNLFDPTTGKYFEWTNEIAGAFLKGTNTFARSIISIKYFHSLNRNTILGSAFEIGWMDYFAASSEIPLSERFYAGGPNSLRAFRYQKAGPLDGEGDPLGGKFKIVWNAAELRRAIYKIIGVAIFADIGNVWRSIDDFSIGDVRISLGLGIRANTPLGIARLDFGFNPDRRGEEPKSQVYFNMGHSF